MPAVPSEHQFDAVRTAVTVLMAGFLGFWSQSVPVTVSVMLGAMALDFLTGVGAAGYMKAKGLTSVGISSKIGTAGMWKKFQQILLVITLAIAAPLLGDPVIAGLSLPEWGAGAIASTEFISILENVKRSGVHVPPALSRLFTVFSEQMQDPLGKPGNGPKEV